MSTTETAIDEESGAAAPAERQRIDRAAREVFGWDPLRPGIARAVAEVLAGRDVLAVMPTGYGKSAVYQLAGALLDSLVVVVSPLIALQADQVAALRDRTGARPAAVVNSAMPEGVMRAERDRVTVFFESEGYRTLSLEDVAAHDLLVRTDRPAEGGRLGS